MDGQRRSRKRKQLVIKKESEKKKGDTHEIKKVHLFYCRTDSLIDRVSKTLDAY